MSASQPADRSPDETPGEPRPQGHAPADWLVGPDEGLAAELERAHGGDESHPRPTLLRPSAPASVAAPEPAKPVASVIPLPVAPAAPSARRASPGAADPDAAPMDGFERGAGTMTWEPSVRSVPALRNDVPAARAPKPTHDFPMDDADERARTSALSAPSFRPHEVVTPDAFDTTAAALPWWVQAAHALRTDRRLHVLTGVVIVALAVVALWPRGDRPTSIATIRRLASRLDGARVVVEGKVGEVFQVGGGYAFYLQDGRDTMVVFTRNGRPVERSEVRVAGNMSTGYLDGLPTLALFEDEKGH